MLFRDTLLHYVQVDAQRNPAKYTAVENRIIENQHQELHHHFFYLYPVFFVQLLTSYWDLKFVHRPIRRIRRNIFNYKLPKVIKNVWKKVNKPNTEHPEELLRKSSKILIHISAYNKVKRPPIMFSNHNIKSFNALKNHFTSKGCILMELEHQ